MLRHRRNGVLATVGAMALALGGCTAAEPASNSHTYSSAPLVIAVITDTPDSTEQMVLGEMYERAFLEEERAVRIDILPANDGEHAITRMRDTFSDLTIGCTGDLLAAFHPDRAAELESEIRADPDGDYRQTTYEMMVGALPANFDAPDPSPAEGCSGAGSTVLPQNIVPIYEKSSLTREDLEVLKELGRSLNTETIQEIVAEARERGSVSGAVSDYYEGEGAFTGSGDHRQDTPEA